MSGNSHWYTGRLFFIRFFTSLCTATILRTSPLSAPVDSLASVPLCSPPRLPLHFESHLILTPRLSLLASSFAPFDYSCLPFLRRLFALFSAVFPTHAVLHVYRRPSALMLGDSISKSPKLVCIQMSSLSVQSCSLSAGLGLCPSTSFMEYSLQATPRSGRTQARAEAR